MPYITSQFSLHPSRISVTIGEVYTSLESLLNTRGSRSDRIAIPLLYYYHHVLSSPICSIFNKLLSEGVFLFIWKYSRVIPILKSRNPAAITNFRSIFVLPILDKIFELIVLNIQRIERLFLSSLSQDQYGFFPGRSTVTSTSSYLHESF